MATGVPCCDLRRRPDCAVFVAFDILQLRGRDLHEMPLIDRKQLLRRTVLTRGSLLCPGWVERNGTALFDQVCRHDLEGIVAKWKFGTYVPAHQQPPDRNLKRLVQTPAAIAKYTWIKVKNPAYTQMEGRAKLFERNTSRTTTSNAITSGW